MCRGIASSACKGSEAIRGSKEPHLEKQNFAHIKGSDNVPMRAQILKLEIHECASQGRHILICVTFDAFHRIGLAFSDMSDLLLLGSFVRWCS